MTEDQKKPEVIRPEPPKDPDNPMEFFKDVKGSGEASWLDNAMPEERHRHFIESAARDSLDMLKNPDPHAERGPVESYAEGYSSSGRHDRADIERQIQEEMDRMRRVQDLQQKMNSPNQERGRKI